MTCSICHQHGHNKKGCKNEPVAQEPKAKKPRGRPRKKQGNDAENVVDDVMEVRQTSAPNVEVRAGNVGGSTSRSGSKNVAKKTNKAGPNKKTVGTSGLNRRTVGTSGSTSKTGSNRNSLKRSCTSAFARWFGIPDDNEADVLDAGQNVEQPEVQVDAVENVEQNQAVQDEDQMEFDLTGTQEVMFEEASQTQDDGADFETEEQVVQVRMRRPSERIMKNKLAKKIDGQGSTPQTALDLDDA